MAAVAEPLRAPAPAVAAGRLRGFQSGAKEFDTVAVGIRGRLPGWLNGALLLNGPALWELPRGALSHWFDGFAMLHRVEIGSGGASYRSRFVRSDAYMRSVAAGAPVYGEFGSPNPSSLLQRIKGTRGTDNPSVVISRHGERWFAVTETPYLTYFDPDTLATVERLDLHEPLHIHLMSAHGFTLADGSYLNVGVELGPKCRYRVFQLPADSTRARVIADIAVPKSGYLHGFGLADGHAIVWECALRARPLAFRFGGASYKNHFRWAPASGSALHAVSLATGAVRSWKIPPLMVFHATQAWSDGDDLLIELAAYADNTIFDDLTLERRRAGEPLRGRPRLMRYRLRPGRDDAEVEALGIELELQQVHPGTIGVRRARCCWGIAMSPRGDFVDHVARVDLDTGAVTEWRRANASHLEPLFVPRPGATDDDDGALLVPTLADNDPASVVAVVDARSMQGLAELQLPQVVPFGFHAAFRAA